jgi:hypothetical protein
VNQQELKAVLELHRKWVISESDGQRRGPQRRGPPGRGPPAARTSGARTSYAREPPAARTSTGRGPPRRGPPGRVPPAARTSGARTSTRADLYGARTSGARTSGARTSSGADLRGADLRGADLQGAYLYGADLQGAKTDPIRDDFFSVLAAAPNEALGLLDAIERGRIKGSAYEGECACLVGTIANLRHENFAKLSINLRPNADRPAERWFLAIREGDIPASNPISAMTADWLRAWLTERGVKFPKYEIKAIWPEP